MLGFSFFPVVVCFPPSGPQLYGEKRELLWVGVGEGLKAVQTPGLATLVLLGRRSLQFPPFLKCVGFEDLV